MNRFLPKESDENSLKISGHDLCLMVQSLVIHTDHLIWFSKQGD